MVEFFKRPLGLLVILGAVLVLTLAVASCSSTPAAAPAKEAPKAAAPVKEEAKPAPAAKVEAKPTAAAAAPAKEAPKPTAVAKEEPKPAAKPAALAAPKEKLTVKMAHNMPIANHLHKTAELFAKRASELSNGQITVEVFPAGQLYNDNSMVEAIATNSVHFGIATSDLLAAEVPGADIFSQPFLFTGYTHLHKAIDGAMGARWKQALEAKGFYPLVLLTYGATNTGSNPRQLKTPDDFKGLKMRAVGAGAAEIFKSLGASPVYMGAGEVYTALQRNTIDGYVTSLASIVDRKLFEVSKYGQVNNMAMGVFPILTSKATWDKFSPEAKAIFEAAAKDSLAWERAEAVRLDEEAVKTLRSKGMDVHVVPPTDVAAYQKATAPALDVYKKNGGALATDLIKLAGDAK